MMICKWSLEDWSGRKEGEFTLCMNKIPHLIWTSRSRVGLKKNLPMLLYKFEGLFGKQGDDYV